MLWQDSNRFINSVRRLDSLMKYIDKSIIFENE
jgi:hypothetical protein